MPGIFSLGSEAMAQLHSGLIHFPVKNASQGRPISIEAKVEDPNVQIDYMRVYFRQKGESDFQYIEMREQLEDYVVEIPARVVNPPGIDYFIMAVKTDRSVMTSPPSNPYYSPHEVTVTADAAPPPESAPAAKKQFRQSASGVDIETVILSPEPNERIEPEDVIIAASFLGEVENIDTESIKLFVDNKDVTANAEISNHVISYVPRGLNLGVHLVRIEMKDSQGNRFDDITWRFTVISEGVSREDGKKLPVSGDVFAEVKQENISDSTLSTTNFGGKFRGRFGPVKYRGLAFITSREKSDAQPRNRFLLEVGTSWIGAKLGDTSPRFNELILWGRRVRGVEAYLKFGFFNLEFVQGEINREIEGLPYDIQLDTETGDTLWIDPAEGDTVTSTTGIYRYGTYKRNLLAVRPSFGSGRNFQLGFNLMKVKDDPESIQYSTQPKDNLVIGPDILFALDNHRIEIKASAAFSFLANDISGGAITQSELDSVLGEVPFDPSDYEEYFVLNTSLIPLDPSELTSLAIQGSFRFNYFNNNLRVIYKSIGSDYYSLANSFLRKDIQGFSIYDRIRLYKNQVYLNLGMDTYKEGLSYENDGEETTEPTDYNAINIGISLFPRQQYWPKVSVNWKNYDRNNGLGVSDTTDAVNYQNKDISVQVGYDVRLFDLNHTLSMSYITMDREDGFNRTTSNLANDIRMYSLRTQYNIPLTTVVTFATNDNNTGEGAYGFEYNMLGLSADYQLLNRRLEVRGGFTMTNAVGSIASYVDDQGNQLQDPIISNYTDYKRTAFNLGGHYQFAKRHQILLDMSFIDFNDEAVDAQSYNDKIFRLRYELRY